MSLIEIKRWDTGVVIYSGEFASVRGAVDSAVKSLADLSLVNLSRANLSGANLSGANLSRANLSWADLSGANLSWANLSRANLSGANLSRANLSGANLSGANLSGADLSGSDLSWANLSGANLSGANLSRANSLDPKYTFLSISPVGSENGCLWTMRGEDGVLKLNRGCFSGTIKEFLAAVNKKHSGTKYESEYKSAVHFIMQKLGVDENGNAIESTK